MAVLIYIAAEQWDWGIVENVPIPMETFGYSGHKIPPSLSQRTAVKYGFEVGLPRLLEILEDHEQKITFWTNANVVIQNPEIMKEAVRAGHELGGHNIAEGTHMSLMSRPEQKRAIAESTKILQEFTGRKPVSWLSPAASCNQDTVELLLEASYKAHGDLQDDELPYFIEKDGKTLVEIPYRFVGNVNDLHFFGARPKVHDVLGWLKNTFDCYYKQASKAPLTFNYGLHTYVSGRPDGAYIFEQFLDYVQQFEDVWIPRYSDIADWWMQKFSKGY